MIGDQQASLFAHGITAPGAAKCTYGTGGFVMLHTGTEPVIANDGLIPTVAYEREGLPPTYALEGSIAVAGALLQWLRDGLGIIAQVSESECIASGVDDSAGVVIVPAFSGLYAPHWRSDARGTIVGLTAYADRRHLVRAALDSIAHQVADVVEAAERDGSLHIESMHADGGATANGLLMQIQADVLGIPVQRPQMIEMTALGAALAAGIGAGIWKDRDSAPQIGAPDAWAPGGDSEWRAGTRATWSRAIERSVGWVA